MPTPRLSTLTAGVPIAKPGVPGAGMTPPGAQFPMANKIPTTPSGQSKKLFKKKKMRL